MAKGINPETGMSCRFKDRTGQRNGRLLFTRCVGETKHRQTLWEAICDCGNIARTTKPNKTLSCGCLQKEKARERALARALPEDERRASIQRNRVRQRVARKNNPVKAMQSRISRLYRHALKQAGGIKSSPTLEELGYTPEMLVRHLERQFVPGMGWHNMSEWQIDHIIPVSSAKSPEDVFALNQLTNLRPMWAKDNNKKKNARENLL